VWKIDRGFSLSVLKYPVQVNTDTIFTNQPENNNSERNENLTPAVQRLIKDYQDSLKPQIKGEMALIHVDEIASKLASFYEKIRRVIDWKEEHLIRRTATERMLKRRMISEISGLQVVSNLKAEEMAEPLVLELIRSGYFPNDKIPRERITEVKIILQKYIYILENSPLSGSESSLKIKERINFYNWILSIAACEIEEILDPPLKENALMKFMANLIKKRIRIRPETSLGEEERKTQINIAVHRTLFRLDAPLISYYLLKHRYLEWRNISPDLLKEITKNILSIRKSIDRDLSHPLSGEFLNLCEKYDTVYLILGDILGSLSEEPLSIPEKLSQPKILEGAVRKAYGKRLSTLKSRLFRSAIYSTLSIFLASGFSLFVIEVPLAKWLYGQFSLLAVAVDILLPTLLMFFLVAMIKPPKASNLEKVIEEVNKIVLPQPREDIYEIQVGKKRSKIAGFIIGFLYILATFVSLGAVFWVFYIAKVPPTSVYIDTLNIAVIVSAALVIRQKSKEIVVEEGASILEFFLDILSVPLGKIGQWLANKWREYNIVSVFFITLVDMPFSALVEFTENWSSFLKKKKAEIR